MDSVKRNQQGRNCYLGQKEPREAGITGPWRKHSTCRRGLPSRTSGLGRGCSVSANSSSVPILLNKPNRKTEGLEPIDPDHTGQLPKARREERRMGIASGETETHGML